MEWFSKFLYFFIKRRNAPARIEPVLPPVQKHVPPILQTPLVDDPDDDKATAFFLHTKKRVFERYGLSLHRDVWEAWNNAINTKEPIALFLLDDNKSSIWRVWFGKQVVFVAFRDDMVVTALPNEGKYKTYVNSALKVRQRGQPMQKKVWHPAARNQNVNKNSSPKLPPKRLRPVRDEKKLAALKAKAMGISEEE